LGLKKCILQKIEIQEKGKVHFSQVFFVKRACKIVKISPKQITTLKTAIEAAKSNFVDQGTNLDSEAVLFLFSIL
jgi:chemotaxis signal transduction protein